MLTFPAAVQAAETYVNARYGAIAQVPDGFAATGPEAANSDGLIFRNKSGAMLTIYGADVPGKDFAAFVEAQLAHEQSYHGWNITGQTVTPDWAEYTGKMGGRQMKVRMLSSCGGRQAVGFKLEYNGNMSSILSRLERSLKAGPAKGC